jgi:hypothetical protein
VILVTRAVTQVSTNRPFRERQTRAHAASEAYPLPSPVDLSCEAYCLLSHVQSCGEAFSEAYLLPWFSAASGASCFLNQQTRQHSRALKWSNNITQRQQETHSIQTSKGSPGLCGCHWRIGIDRRCRRRGRQIMTAWKPAQHPWQCKPKSPKYFFAASESVQT